jgi:hypothetical protein
MRIVCTGWLLPALAMLGGCTTPLGYADDTRRIVALGQSVDLGLVTVRPLDVAEDSRCPAGVECIQAGRLVLRAEVAPPSTGRERMLTLGEPLAVAGGILLLEKATPLPGPGVPVDARAYRFTLHFQAPKRL